MNKKMKTVLLTLLFTFTVALAGKVLADTILGNSSTDEGKISVNKTATKEDVTYGRSANVELSVTGTEFTTSTTLDVVLVLDRSGSMNGQRMIDTKDAANQLATDLLKNNTSDRTVVNMGIVTYGTDILSSYTSNNLTSNVTTITNLINSIPNYVNNEGTNIQSGLTRANSLLANSTAKNKVVILLTDGMPTFFTYNNEIKGNGGSDKSVCIDWGTRDCKEWRKPSEAATIEASAMKNAGIKIYTVGFNITSGSDADTFLKTVATTTKDAYLAKDKAELLKQFNNIITSITTIANNVKVEDIIPAGFVLDEEALKNTYGEEVVQVTHNADGTTKITWNIGTLSVTDDLKLTYKVTAKEENYGGMYTNASAVLTGTAVEGNPAYPNGTIEEIFPMPEVAIPMVTKNDSYTATLGTTLNVDSSNGILKNDSKIKMLDGEDTTVTDQINIKSVSCGKVTDIKVNADGSFTYTPNSACYGKNDNKVTFEYEVSSKVVINGEEKTVISNTSAITIDLTKEDATIENPEVTKINDNGLTTKSITGPFNYTVQYTATIENHIGTTTVTIVDTLPYELDETKTNVLSGGEYDATTKTITWKETIENIDSYQNQNNEINIVKHITVFYKNVPTDVETIVNSATVTTDIDNTSTETEQETEVVRGNLVVEYVDNLGNSLEDSIKSAGLIDSEYTTKAFNTITKDGVEYQLVRTKVNGEKVDLTNNYSSKYVEGTTTVTYVYYKVTGDIDDENTNITKEGTDKVTTSTSEFDYTITYHTTIDNYIGNATLTITDTLPYAIDLAKSDIGEGEYDATNKTITWEITYNDINTYLNGAYPINVVKNIKVVFMDIDASERTLTNNVSGTIETSKSTDTKTDDKTTDLEIKGTVIAHYVDTLNNTIASDEETTDLVGNTYTTTAKTITGYTLVRTEGAKTTGNYVEGVLEVTYVYYKVEGNIDTDNTRLLKTGTDKVTSVTDSFEYKIEYHTVITDYIGDAKVTIVDNLPYAIDLSKSELNGGVYNEDAHTITWEEEITNIDTNTNGNKEISITKTISVVYVGLEPTTRLVTNEVVATVRTSLNEETTGPVTKDSAVEVKGIVTSHYVSTTGETLSEDIEQSGLVGNDYTTTEKEIEDYKLVDVKGNKQGIYTVDPIEVTYIYYKVTGDITDDSIEKIGNEVITSKNEKFNYTIHYQTTIENYIGLATVTIVDQLPQAIDVTESYLNGGIYDSDNLTITWRIDYDVNTYESDSALLIDVTKELVLVYEELDPSVDEITNKVTATVTTEKTEETKEDDVTTEVNIEGTVTVKYIDELGQELTNFITMTGKVGKNYTTEELEFDGYELIKIEGDPTGKYKEEETLITYIYTKFGKGGDVEVLPPQTGVESANNSSVLLTLISSICLGLFLAIKKFI